MESNTDVVIDEKIKQKNSFPNTYHVILLNDNTTPIEWVVEVLSSIFKHSAVSAESLTLEIHNEGSAVVGTYQYEIAEQKAIETTNLSRDKGFPLQVKVEENK